MWSYKDHGKSWQGVYERQHPPGPRLVHDTFGTNWRMLEMQAAIGLVQLDLMPEWIERRQWAAREIAKALESKDSIRLPAVPNYARHAYYRLYAFVRPEALKEGWTRDRIIEEIVAEGVPCMHGSQSEVYLEAAFDGTGWKPPERLPNARELGDTSIAFLVHPTLSDAEIGLTREVIDRVFARAAAG
jgi:dTDP-4-amino-4,6-dideoxygalactose transaminase